MFLLRVSTQRLDVFASWIDLFQIFTLARDRVEWNILRCDESCVQRVAFAQAVSSTYAETLGDRLRSWMN